MPWVGMVGRRGLMLCGVPATSGGSTLGPAEGHWPLQIVASPPPAKFSRILDTLWSQSILGKN